MPRAGSSFENLVVEHFQNYIKKGEISDVIKPFIEYFDLSDNKRIDFKNHTKNNASNRTTISTDKVREKIADIILNVTRNNGLKEKIYISLKDGKSVNLISKGMMRLYGSIDENMKKEGEDFLKAFGISKDIFLKFFSKNEKISPIKNPRFSKQKLNNILRNMIGENYYIFHRMENTSRNNFQLMEIKNKTLDVKKISKITFGSEDKVTKRIEVEILTNLGIFKAQFRRNSSKQTQPNACTIWWLM